MFFDIYVYFCSFCFVQDFDVVFDCVCFCGVVVVVVVSEIVEDVEVMFEIVVWYVVVCLVVGFYLMVFDFEQVECFEVFLCECCDEIFVVGEIGFDYWKVKEFDELELQEKFFCCFVWIVKEFDLLVNVYFCLVG